MNTPTRPHLERNGQQAWIAGVASGVARHMNWPIWLARMCFIALTLTSFAGVVIYGVLWAVMPMESHAPLAPGLDAHTRTGLRTQETPSSTPNVGRALSVSMLVFGIIMLVQGLGFGVSGSLFGPALLASMGIALVWIEADIFDARDMTDAPAWARPLLAGRGIGAVLRVVLGITLVGLAVSVVALNQVTWTGLADGLWVSALTVGGIGVLAAPWVLRFNRKLNQAKEDRLVADTRADMAAHLHDSVLQTLALIQRQAEDPRQVAALARRQERELRTWLYGETSHASSLKEALTTAAADVDADRGVPVEVVCVGDTAITERLNVLIQAAKEAMTNAAKHSQASVIDVFADVEVDDETLVTVYVRDRGVGFDIEEIGEDRLGVRRSIIERMERHGGTARIKTAPGEGTEIRLEMTA